MIIEICNIHRISKSFMVGTMMITKALFAITLLQYYRAVHDSGFGLFALKAGRLPECRNRLGMKVNILWWEWSWIRDEK